MVHTTRGQTESQPRAPCDPSRLTTPHPSSPPKPQRRPSTHAAVAGTGDGARVRRGRSHRPLRTGGLLIHHLLQMVSPRLLRPQHNPSSLSSTPLSSSNCHHPPPLDTWDASSSSSLGHCRPCSWGSTAAGPREGGGWCRRSSMPTVDDRRSGQQRRWRYRGFTSHRYPGSVSMVVSASTRMSSFWAS
ncbi:hypothetical protein U9M48_041481 [Paspalum notatum var. saurae]|uniref:Uncharacterized protein n=1 Tax=Paspalum notatum var. saurae TaxID=547442 RepID=A0AAQ3XGK4_PASNO